MSLRSGNWVLMLHWIRWRHRVSGATWVDSMEVKSTSFWLREGGGWQQCMEMGGASTGGIAKVNLKMRTRIKWVKNWSQRNLVALMKNTNGTTSFYLSIVSLSMSTLCSMLWMASFTAWLWNQKSYLFCHWENRQLLWPERPHSLSELRVAGLGRGPGRKVRKSRTSWPYMGLAPQRRSLTRKIKSSRLLRWSLKVSDNHDCWVGG